MFDKWTPAFKNAVDASMANTDSEIIYMASWKKIVVPTDPGDPDYVKVTFDPAAHGTISGGDAEQWVLKNVTATVEAPTVAAESGWWFAGWDADYTDVEFSADTVIHAKYLPFIKPANEDGDPVPGDIHDEDGNDTSDTPLDPDPTIECADGSDTCASFDDDDNLVIPDDENGNPPDNVDITTIDTDGDGDIDTVIVDPHYPQVDNPDSHTKYLEVTGKVEVGKELTMDEPSEVADFVDRHLVKDAASGDVRLASVHYTGKKVGADSFQVAYWVNKASGSPDYIVTYKVDVFEKAGAGDGTGNGSGKSGVSTRGLSSTGSEVGSSIALAMLMVCVGAVLTANKRRKLIG